MGAEVIGRVRGGKSGNSYEVKWNKGSGDVYVGYAGTTNIGRASSAGQAMDRAEAWVHDK